MASAGFQLFPPPPPRMGQPPAKRTGTRRPYGKNEIDSPISPIIEIDKSSSQTETVVIQIIEQNENAAVVQVPPMAVVVDSRSPSPEAKAGERGISPLLNSPQRSWAASPAIQQSNSPAVVHSNAASPSTRSPVRMRSIFPKYNPQLPLNQQHYYPQRGASPPNLPAQVVQRGEYSPSATSPSRLDQVLGGPKTAPASVLDFPLDALEPMPQTISSSADLEKMWDAANGQFENEEHSQLALGMTFQLEVFRSEAATFVFGPSDSSQAFYSLQTFSNNDFTITRHHPFKQALNAPVMASSLESQSRRRSPYDGLVAQLFPKLAARLAIDEATLLTQQNRLSPDIAEQVATDAVKRAGQLEGSRLTFNDKHNRYELFMPCLGPQNPTAQTQPDRSQTPPNPGCLHIHVSNAPDSSSASITGAALSYDPVILVTNPRPPVALDPATPRTSTLPLDNDESSEPLASLDFSTGALTVCTPQIASLVPSIYAIDTIVSAVLAVAVADETTNRVMGALPVGVRIERAPLPRRMSSMPNMPSLRRTGTIGSVRSTYTSTTIHTHIQPKVLVATLAERPDHNLNDDSDPDEQTLMSSLRNSRSAKSATNKKSGKTHPSPTGKRKTAKKLRTKKITVAELDVEKYAAGGEELPAVTQGLVGGLFLGLQFVVWLLSVAVEFLAWVLVKTTRCVTSENF